MAGTDQLLILGGTMRVLVFLVVVVVGSYISAAQGEWPLTLGEVKQWMLHTKHGDVDIRLGTYPTTDNSERSFSLSLTPKDHLRISAGEGASLLRQVLHNMSYL